MVWLDSRSGRFIPDTHKIKRPAAPTAGRDVFEDTKIPSPKWNSKAETTHSVYLLATDRMVRESNPSKGEVFPNLSRPALEPMQHHIQWVPGLFPSVKRLGREDDHLALRLKKKEELYLCSSSEHSRPVLG